MSKEKDQYKQINDQPTPKPARRPYKSPSIISCEPLESTAVTCSPPTGGYGKNSNSPQCLQGLGS